ncbi:MAG: hypothetical protein Q7R70_03220 [Candidatus Diapherotrites archaeon]|nr:hypothetical protein [Candidatus Diapherotrites archaeon]
MPLFKKARLTRGRLFEKVGAFSQAGSRNFAKVYTKQLSVATGRPAIAKSLANEQDRFSPDYAQILRNLGKTRIRGTKREKVVQRKKIVRAISKKTGSPPRHFGLALRESRIIAEVPHPTSVKRRAK